MADTGGFDPQFYASLPDTSQAQNRPGPFGSGLGVFLHGLLGTGGAAVQGAGLALGMPSVTQAGQSFADRQAAITQRIDRVDLDTSLPASGGKILPWAEYQLSKLAPVVAAYTLAGGAAGRFAPEALSPESRIALGSLPRALGGAGAGATAEEIAAAGQRSANFAVGGGVYGGVTGFGQAIQSADQKPGGATVDDAKQALEMSPVYAAAGLVTPGFLHGALKGAEGNFLTRIVSNAAKGSAVGAVQSGVLAGLDQTFRPDLTPQQKLANVVDATVTGASVAGLAGGILGIRGLRHIDPANISTDMLDQETEHALALPAPDHPGGPQMGSGPTMYADGAGRVGDEAALRGAPVDIGMSPTDRMFADAIVPQAQPAIESQTIIQPKRGSLRWAQDYEQGALRPYESADPKALTNYADIMGKYLSAREGQPLDGRDQKIAEQHQLVLDELSHHASVNSSATDINVPVETAGAVERGSNVSGGSAAENTAVPAPANSPTVSNILKGVSTRKSYVDAKSIDEVKARVIDRLEKGSSAKGDLVLAERLGVDLNEPAKMEAAQAGVPGQAGTETSVAGKEAQTTAPAAPANVEGGDRTVDASFQRQFTKDLTGRQGLAIKDLRDNPPANAGEARERLFDLLGKGPEHPDISGKDGYQAVVDLAQKYGVLDKDEKYTPQALDIARKGISMDEAVSEAQNRGYTGSDAAAFDSGARGQPVKLGSIEALKVYNEGRDWAHNSALPDNLSSAAETSKYVRDNVAGTNGRTVRSAGIPDTQRNMQFLNQAIDQVYGSTIKPQEQAQLKRMAKEGASGKEIDDAARYFASGRGALVQEQPLARAFKGEVVTRGLVNAKRLAAAQSEAAGHDLGEKLGKSSRLATDRAAIRAYEIKENLKAAHTSGDITSRQLIAGLAKINSGDIEGAKNILPGEVPERVGEGAPGITAEQAQQAVDKATSSLKGDNRIQVHQSFSDVPGDLRAQLSSDTVKGFYDRGTSTMHIIADNHDSPEDVHATVYHELLGHKGLEAAFGQRLGQLMSSIYRTNDGMRNLANDYLDATGKWADQSQEVRQRLAIEEVLAEGSEQGPITASAWERLTHTVREFGRKLGFDIKYNAADVQAIVARAHDAITNGRAPEVVQSSAPRIDERMQSSVKQVSQEAGAKVKDLLDRTDAKEKVFRVLLKTQPGSHLVEQYATRKPVMPELRTWQRVLEQRDAVRNTLAKVGLVASDRFTKLQNDKPEMAQKVNDVMLAAASGFNPELPWAKQTWLHNDPQAGLLKKSVDAAFRDASALRAAGHMDVYAGFKNELEAVNLVHMLQRLNLLVAHDPTMSDAAAKVGDPIAAWLEKTDMHNPEAAVEYFRNALTSSMSALDTHFQSLRNDPTLVDKQRVQLETHLSPIEAEMKQTQQYLGSMRQTPYFHLYREGDHMAAAKLRVLEGGRADPAAARAVSDALAKAGFKDVKISPDLANPQIYLTIDNKSQRNLVERVLQQLSARKLLDPDSVLTGPRAREALLSEGSRQAMEHVLGQVRANPLFSTEGKTAADAAVINEHRAIVEDALREAWLNSLPTNSISRVMAHRENVQGFSKDMALSTAYRFGVGIASAARMWARPHLNDVFTQIESRRAGAMSVNSAQHADVDTIHALASEVRQRDIQQFVGDRHDWTDTARMLSNVYHIGFSPVQIVVHGSQLPILVLPHLGARHGFATTFSAMARATPLALRVIREALAQGYKVSAARAADIALTHDVLAKAVPDQATRTFLERVIATGAIDTGTNTRSLTGEAGLDNNPKLQKMMRFASITTQSMEMVSRLVTSLASRQLHSDSKMSGAPEDYAVRVLNDTLGQYTASNAAPIFSKKGPFGKAGPMMLQFKQFDTNLIWKLYREVNTAIGGKTAADRAEAGKFLLGHAVVVTALAGSLGLPFAGVAAGLVDKLKDELAPDDHPFDATAYYRNFLADVLGGPAADVVAKGTPRALDFDLSNRVGEDDVLPFTQLLVDRRNWSDTVDQWGAQAVGAPASMVTNVLKGLDQIHDGNLLGGMATAMPSFLRHVAQSYQMTDKGYVDSRGNPLPLPTPGAADILIQLLGATPAEKAEYYDDRGVQLNAKASLTRTSNSIKNQLQQAITSGDDDAARQMIERAQKFDEANPTYAILPRIRQDIARAAYGPALSAAIGAPPGVKPADLYARGLTKYSTVDYTQH